MVELMIVTAIIPIASLATYGLISTLNNGRARTEAHIDATESSSRFAARWRDDIEMASKVDLADDGKSMTIARLSAEGRAIEIRYGLSRKGKIARIEEGRKPEVLCAGAEGLGFAKIGAGYRADWKLGFDDGATKMTWEKRAFATPLGGGQE